MTKDATFTQGMFVTLWPKLGRCHKYVEMLVAAQEKLQSTVDELLAGLEANNVEGRALASYADRLRNFPARVERMQKKLAQIQDRLHVMKESWNPHLLPLRKFSGEEAAVYASPLF